MQFTVEQIARTAHEATRGYLKSLGDDSLPSWAKLPAHVKDAYVMTVIGMVDDPDATPEQAHRIWRMKQLQAGWNLGDVYDAVVKTNPDMLPYTMLPEDRRARDVVFHSVVRALITE